MEKKMTIEKATEMLDHGFHCSQCVFSHAADLFDLDPSMALKMSGGLGAGCFHGEICGTVTAAILTLGLAYGYDQPDSSEQNEILVEKLQRFKERFTEKHGSLLCRDLLGGYSFAIPEDEEKIDAEDLTKDCPRLCASACEILDDILGG